MYGLKQARRPWYEILHSYLILIGFNTTSNDNNIYLKVEGENILITEVFVDNIIFGGDDEMSMYFDDEMKKEFEMSMIGELKFFIGLKVSQLDNGIYISQSKYIKEVLKTFGMEASKLVGTPMIIGCKVSKDDESKYFDATLYMSMIRKLHYVLHRRLDIAKEIGIVARFQSNPKESHMVAVKIIFRYLKGTIDYWLWYAHEGDFSLSVFIDADWEGNIDDWKSTSGGTFFLGGSLVSWTSKKQNFISQSTTKVEYVEEAINCTKVDWMKKILEGIKEKVKKLVIIYCDNTSAINISKNLVMHSKTKHIAIKYHFLR